MTEPRFVNLDSHPIYVTSPDGQQRVVRPFRELQAFTWRKEEDCVCTGAHYAKFTGLLSPFPGDEPAAAVPVPAPAVPAVGVAASAPRGRFKGTGDVIGQDGKVKRDAPSDPAPVAPAVAEPVRASEPVDPEPAADEAGEPDDAEPEQAGDDAGADDQPDRPLEDVPGVTKKLAIALRKAGFDSAVALANCQDKKSIAALGKVPGVKDALALAEAAQELLGWEEVDEEEGEDV